MLTVGDLERRPAGFGVRRTGNRACRARAGRRRAAGGYAAHRVPVAAGLWVDGPRPCADVAGSRGPGAGSGLSAIHRGNAGFASAARRRLRSSSGAVARDGFVRRCQHDPRAGGAPLRPCSQRGQRVGEGRDPASYPSRLGISGRNTACPLWRSQHSAARASQRRCHLVRPRLTGAPAPRPRRSLGRG